MKEMYMFEVRKTDETFKTLRAIPAIHFTGHIVVISRIKKLQSPCTALHSTAQRYISMATD